MSTKNTLQKNPGLVLVISYFIMFLVNAVTIYTAHLLFPQQVVLGTLHIPLIWAIILSMGILTLACTFIIPIVRFYEDKAGRMLNSFEWMLLYFIVNLAGLWLIARFADVLGLGLSSWFVAAILAVVLDIIQGGAMMQFEKFRSQ